MSTACLCLVATIVAYLKEVESPYAVLDFIRSYLGDTVEAKEFAKQFLERRAKQKANQQRQQQQVGWSPDCLFVMSKTTSWLPGHTKYIHETHVVPRRGCAEYRVHHE